MICPRCGERMIGDGVSEPIRCPNVEFEKWSGREPDCNPVLCQGDECD